MNFFEAQEFFKKIYPDRLLTFEFDGKCIHQIEAIHADGEMREVNHIEYRYVKVTPQGLQSIYVPIQPHRMLISADELKKHIGNTKIKKE